MAEKQGELDGIRPKRLAALETVCRDLMDAKDQQKRAKDVVDAAADRVAAALKRADLLTYGWKEDGHTYIVQLEDKETVKISVKGPKDKKE